MQESVDSVVDLSRKNRITADWAARAQLLAGDLLLEGRTYAKFDTSAPFYVTAAADQLGFDTAALQPEHLRSLMLMMIGDSDRDEGILEILSQSRIRTIPEDFALVVRTLILLNGLSHRLVPNRRLIQGELIQHLAAGAARA